VSRPRTVAAAESSACERVNAVGLTSSLDRGQFFSLCIFISAAMSVHCLSSRRLDTSDCRWFVMAVACLDKRDKNT